MSNVITLSSSDEESSPSPPKKRIKPTFLGSSIRIAKVTSARESAVKPKKSLQEILAASKIGNSISITPVSKNNNKGSKKSIGTANEGSGKQAENIVVLSDEEDIVKNDPKTKPNESAKSHNHILENETIILDEENSLKTTDDSESDDDCVILNDSVVKEHKVITQAKLTSPDTGIEKPKSNSFEIADMSPAIENPASNYFEITDVSTVIEHPASNSFEITDLPPVTENSKTNSFEIVHLPRLLEDPKSNIFEKVELSEIEKTSGMVNSEAEVNSLNKTESKIESEHCDKIGTKSETQSANGILDKCTVVADRDSPKENFLTALAEKNESSSNLNMVSDTTVEQHNLTGTNCSSDGEGCSSNKENSFDHERPSRSTSHRDGAKQTVPHLIGRFLEVCEKSVKGSKFEEIILKKSELLLNRYKKCGANMDSSQFQKVLEDHITKAEISAPSAVVSFKQVLILVKDFEDVGCIEVSKERKRNLKKLEHVMKSLLKKIKSLENAEVDFDKEEDSKFMQLDRYNVRLVKVHQKYCALLNKNPYSGRLTHSKLDFVDSEYTEINRAISKKFKDNNKFPSYMEMEKFIRKVAEEHKLNFSEQKLRSESIYCFKKLGELLQNRRRTEFYEDHYNIIGDKEDPAATNADLNTKLFQSYKEGLKKMDKICEEFVIKQETAAEPDLSQEDASVKSSDSD